MKHSSIKIFIIILALSFISSCGKKTKSYLIGKDYINLMESDFKATADKSLSEVKIPIAKAEIQKSWTNSNFNLAHKHSNIKIDGINFTKQKKYSLYRNNNIYGSNYSPVIDEGKIYVIDNKNHLHAFDINRSYKKLWSRPLVNKYKTTEFAGGGISKYKDLLVVTDGSNNVAAVDANNGDLIWNAKISNISRSSPDIHDELAYVLTIDNKLYCFDIYTGTIKWIHASAMEQFGVFGSATSNIYNNNVVAPYSSGQLVMLDSKTGVEIWNKSLVNNQQNSTSLYMNDIDMTPLVADDTIYVGNYMGTLFAIDGNNARVKWQNESAGGNSDAWNTEDFIFTVNKFSQLLAIYKLDGHVKWVLDLKTQEKLKKDAAPFYSGPIMINGKLILTSSTGSLFEIDTQTGKVINRFNIPKDIYAPPIVADNLLYLFNNNGTLVVIN